MRKHQRGLTNQNNNEGIIAEFFQKENKNETISRTD